MKISHIAVNLDDSDSHKLIKKLNRICDRIFIRTPDQFKIAHIFKTAYSTYTKINGPFPEANIPITLFCRSHRKQKIVV
jgi:hypothetical protein